MIKFIHSISPDTGIEALTAKLITTLRSHKRTLWLICGGSNIPTAVEVMNTLRQELSFEDIKHLTVMQTDERYGPVGHADSNWRQMMDLNFNTVGIKVYPILRNLPLKETVTEFGKEAEQAFKNAEVIIGQLGMGPDGHVAGILPYTQATKDNGVTSGYEAVPFTRVTLTFPMIEKINFAYVFAFGTNKREAVTNLQNKELLPEQEPIQILKKLAEVYFYSDQIELRGLASQTQTS